MPYAFPSILFENQVSHKAFAPDCVDMQRNKEPPFPGSLDDA
jgi:hypothetical protein